MVAVESKLAENLQPAVPVVFCVTPFEEVVPGDAADDFDWLHGFPWIEITTANVATANTNSIPNSAMRRRIAPPLGLAPSHKALFFDRVFLRRYPYGLPLRAFLPWSVEFVTPYKVRNDT
jgi:hypothetical protein